MPRTYPPKMTRVLALLPPGYVQALDVIARSKRKSRNAVIRDAVTLYLYAEERRIRREADSVET